MLINNLECHYSFMQGLHDAMISAVDKAKQPNLSELTAFIPQLELVRLSSRTEAQQVEMEKAVEAVLEILTQKKSAEDAKTEAEEMTKRSCVLEASAIVSPIYQSYFGFAPVFQDAEFTPEETVVQKQV